VNKWLHCCEFIKCIYKYSPMHNAWCIMYSHNNFDAIWLLYGCDSALQVFQTSQYCVTTLSARKGRTWKPCTYVNWKYKQFLVIQAQSDPFHFSFNAYWYFCWQTICQGVCWFTKFLWKWYTLGNHSIWSSDHLLLSKTLWYTTLSVHLSLSWSLPVLWILCSISRQETGQSGISTIVSWTWLTEHLQLLWNSWDICTWTLPPLHHQEYA